MAPVLGYLIDTNVLLRLSRHEDSQHDLVQAAMDELNRQDVEFYFSLQNITEFWNVYTRPAAKNGFGLSIEETVESIESIEEIMTFLPDTGQVYSFWRQLVVDLRVRGVQVHDAHLAAIMQAYGVTHILTLNKPDFLRYRGLTPIHPSEVLLQGR